LTILQSTDFSIDDLTRTAADEMLREVEASEQITLLERNRLRDERDRLLPERICRIEQRHAELLALRARLIQRLRIC
jgi:hypothetical protein